MVSIFQTSKKVQICPYLPVATSCAAVCAHTLGREGQGTWECISATCATRDFHFARIRSWFPALVPAHQYRWLTTALIQELGSSACSDLPATTIFFLMAEIQCGAQSENEAVRVTIGEPLGFFQMPVSAGTCHAYLKPSTNVAAIERCYT